MIEDPYYLASVILLFSTVQSIFGVGLLLFGTPTLLLSGYSYDTTLWTLLPCSVVISATQSIVDRDLVVVKRELFYYTLPALAIGLSAVSIYVEFIDISKLVGFLLIVIGIMKVSSYLQSLIKLYIEKYLKTYYTVMGFIHGISNMGGGPLSVLISTLHTDKNIIRTNIAFVYLMFGLSQLAVLVVVSSQTISPNAMWYITVSLLSYMFVSKFIAPRIDDKKYQSLITGFILLYGFVSIL